jgi:hypothetical protein
MEVFGIDEPNPFTFDENQMRNSNIMADSVPQAKTVWAKTQDLGIIERKKDRISQLEVPSNLASSTPIVKENQYPGAPTRQFPDQTQAVLIEGYVFPAHKEKLAKKVEHAVQHNMDYEANDIILSDSDESSDVASSCSSWDISDDEVDATFSALELPLFANLWRLFSAWITHETNLLVAGFPIPLKKQTDDITEKEKNPEELAARRVLAESNHA